MSKLLVNLDYYECRFLWFFVRYALEVYCGFQYRHGNLTQDPSLIKIWLSVADIYEKTWLICDL